MIFINIVRVELDRIDLMIAHQEEVTILDVMTLTEIVPSIETTRRLRGLETTQEEVIAMKELHLHHVVVV